MKEKGYLLKKLAENVYFFSTGRYNNMFVVTPEGVIVTDPIFHKGGLLKQAIAEITEQPVRFLIYSHAHLDHIGDAHLFAREGVQIIAHRAAAQRLARYDHPRRPLPHITFRQNYTLKLGGIEVELLYPGEGHAEGNIIIHVPARKVMMFVDVAIPRSVPFGSFATTDIYGQVLGLQRALELDFDVYVGGHWHRPGAKKEFQQILRYYYAVKKANERALNEVSLETVAAQAAGSGPQEVWARYRRAVAEHCHRLLKPRWQPEMMGFEAFARSHCDAWTSFHRQELEPGKTR